MITERLKVDRALTILPPPGMPLALRETMTNRAQAYAATEPPQRRTLHLVSTDQDERPTQPPSAPPPGMYTDAVVDDLLATAKRLEEHYKTLLAPEGLLEKNVDKISGLIDANYRLIHNEVIGIRGTLDALAPRVTKTEERLDNLEQIRAEFESMKVRMSEFESMRTRMSQIETALGLRTA